MSILSAISGPAASPNSSRGKPRLALRGKSRKLVRDLLRKITNVRNMDDRENVRAISQGYSPLLFKVRNNSAIDTATLRLADRCIEMLAERI